MCCLEVQIFVLFMKDFHFSDPDHADSFLKSGQLKVVIIHG